MAYFSLRITPSEETKLIISVGKKVSNKAVVRNSIKRRVRAVMRGMKLRRAHYLLIARPGSENIKGKELESELIRIIRN